MEEIDCEKEVIGEEEQEEEVGAILFLHERRFCQPLNITSFLLFLFSFPLKTFFQDIDVLQNHGIVRGYCCLAHQIQSRFTVRLWLLALHYSF